MLLKKLGIEFEVVVSNIEEVLDPALKSTQQALNIAMQKAKNVSFRASDSIIIAADTTVVIGDLVLGKPKDSEDAIKMLEMLSGKMHSVITGFVILDKKSEKIISKSLKNKVWFRKLDKFEIENYIDQFHPFDKAGAYGIQDVKDIFVEKFEGDYSSVLGLPVHEVANELKKLGVNISKIKDPI